MAKSVSVKVNSQWLFVKKYTRFTKKPSAKTIGRYYLFLKENAGGLKAPYRGRGENAKGREKLVNKFFKVPTKNYPNLVGIVPGELSDAKVVISKGGKIVFRSKYVDRVVHDFDPRRMIALFNKLENQKENRDLKGAEKTHKEIVRMVKNATSEADKNSAFSIVCGQYSDNEQTKGKQTISEKVAQLAYRYVGVKGHDPKQWLTGIIEYKPRNQNMDKVTFANFMKSAKKRNDKKKKP